MESLKGLRSKRTAVRRRVTHLGKLVVSEGGKQPLDLEKLNATLGSVDEVRQELFNLDRSILDKLRENGVHNNEIDLENNRNELYHKKLGEMEVQLNEFLKDNDGVEADNNNMRRGENIVNNASGSGSNVGGLDDTRVRRENANNTPSSSTQINPLTKLRVKRDGMKNAFKKVWDDIKTELSKPEPEVVQLTSLADLLKWHMSEVHKIDQEIINVLLDEEANEECSREQELTLEYRRGINIFLTRIDKYIKITSPVEGDTRKRKSTSDAVVSAKLPKKDLGKFDGDVRQWVNWWNDFDSIHKNPDIDVTDKFHFLAKYMKPNSEAFELVDSYPRVPTNYEKAVEDLKKLYRRPELLQDVYMTDLHRLADDIATNRVSVTAIKLYNTVNTKVRHLESLGFPVSILATCLYPTVEKCLKGELLSSWERSPHQHRDGLSENPPKTRLQILLQFLEEEANHETRRKVFGNSKSASSSAESNKGKSNRQNVSKKNGNKNKVKVSTTAELVVVGKKSEKKQNCIFCSKANHPSIRCFKGAEMSKDDRVNCVETNKVCYKCLNRGHFSRDCDKELACGNCGMPHATIMCYKADAKTLLELVKKENPMRKKNDKQNKQEDSSISGVALSMQCRKDILLGTCVVRAIGPGGSVTTRLIVDSGAQTSHVGSAVISHTRSPKVRDEFVGTMVFGGILQQRKLVSVRNLTLQSLDEKVTVQWQMYEKDAVCPGIPRIPDGPWIEDYGRKGITFSDREGGRVELPEVEILIGRDYLAELMTGRRDMYGGGLHAEQTVFGWTLAGPIRDGGSIAVHQMTHYILNCNIQNLWELDLMGIREDIHKKSREEQDLEAVRQFRSSTTREDDGRYEVALPWIEEKKHFIPTNRWMADKRLETTSKKLQEKKMFETYSKIFEEWENLSFVEKVPITTLDDDGCHYLPHHPVFKESVTTPVRPVFDASSKTGRQLSLNNCLYSGPNLLEEIPAVMNRFREGAIGFTSDIRKAFQMIGVRQEDRDYLRFLWWANEDCKEKVIYRHKRVPFGATSSPWLLAAVLHFHLSKVEGERREVAEKLLQYFYVDNCCGSVDTIASYEKFKEVAVDLLAEAQMDLRQWARSRSHSKVQVQGESDMTLDEEIKVLGLIWNRIEDSLRCDTKNIQVEGEVTKRKILSYLQQVFDPVGFVSPALILPKLLLQQSWRQKIGWDREIPDGMKQSFLKWWRELEFLEKVKVPRQIVYDDEVELHTFCDASRYAYATVVFAMCKKKDVHIMLIQAKSRLAPLKLTDEKSFKNAFESETEMDMNTPSIPRLELLACLIGARLTKYVINSLGRPLPVTLWSDSSTALTWIKRSSEWGTFVGNRVSEIIETFDANCWRFVPGKDNPADLPSRGCSPRNLATSKWWEGPEWLRHEDDWPQVSPDVDEEVVMKELKKKSIVLTTNFCELENFLLVKGNPRYSSYFKTVRVLGWIRRFVENVKRKKRGQEKVSGRLLKWEEFRAAETQVLKFIQKDSFEGESAKELKRLKVHEKDGLLVGESQLLYTEESEGYKMPIILSHHHPLVKMLIDEEHRLSNHGGVRYLLTKLRERYFILKPRQAIKSVVHKCIVCKKYKAKPYEVDSISLPKDRLSGEVFQTVGVDLFGPLYLKDSTKVWVVLYTCGVYRCIYLDVIEGLDAESFARNLERFVCHYGRPTTIYSDNATNFTKVGKALQEMSPKWWERVHSLLKTKPFHWKFIPPSAPWWGGWWERLVQTVKVPLRKVLKNKEVNLDELRTIIASVSATVNDRPLTYIADEDELMPLTPAMFLHPTRSSLLVESDSRQFKDTIGKQYRRMKHLQEQLHLRFKKEYLTQLMQHGKLKKKRLLEAKLGEIVLIGQDNKKRGEWSIGRIVELMPGKDKKVRVVKVATPHEYVLIKKKNGVMKTKVKKGPVLIRAVQRLYPLELDIPEDVPLDPKIKNVVKAKHVANKEQTLKKKDEPARVTTRSGRKIKQPVRYGQLVQIQYQLHVDEDSIDD